MSDEEMRKLADRCEAATGPSHELDVAIAEASLRLGFTIFGDPVRYDPRLWAQLNGPITASLDAALTLVPEGWHFSLHANSGELSRAAAYQLAPPAAWSYAATPALALCAASLRARAAHLTKENPDVT